MTSHEPARIGRRIRVCGLVQGVGFRPFVWRLAREEGITGSVLNDSSGVLIEAFAVTPDTLDRLAARLVAEAPALARIDSVAVAVISGPAPAVFSIAESKAGRVATGIVADAATCPQCLAEVLDPADRRWRYPFANCTHCGPRLSVVRSLPYDRANTSMASFVLCAECAREYADPADRRFHAQPVACPACGPRLWVEHPSGDGFSASPGGDAVDDIAAIIASGGIVAIKGLGGFHLACDATSEAAVVELRRRKHRDAKPFALMVRDLEAARRLAVVSEAEAALLSSPAAPIVLVERVQSECGLPAAVAPNSRRLGLMLAYTPLHHLLMRAVEGPLVMTSGNRSSEPQCITNEAARERLLGIADALAMHDRDIVNRIDDSVLRVDASGPAVLRRARGYAPQPVRLAIGRGSQSPVLALGGELKSTFCFLRNREATLSQHLGDLEEALSYDAFCAALDLYLGLYEVKPAVVAVDKHPGYRSTMWGEAFAREIGAQLVRVQHHHAHLASCLAENQIGLDGADAIPSLGIVLDGLGLGDDGTIWGGEFLLGGYAGFERVGHLEPVRLPGGAMAMREPWRNTYAHFNAALGPDWLAENAGLELARWLKSQPLAILDGVLARGVNSPLASSMGRVFDAAAGALNVCRSRQSYEGQAAMELEALAEPWMGSERGYPTDVRPGLPMRLDLGRLWRSLVADLRSDIPAPVIAARFHAGVIDGLVATTAAIAAERRFARVALTGGVFQNRILRDGVSSRLTQSGYDVVSHQIVPANDGGLSLGQAAIAACAV